jgi:PAS domain S-box-containing protein/diguanylate cyclase (GGDEF)-like protein
MLWALLDLVDDAVVTVGVDGLIRHLNAAAPEVFGEGARELIGQPLAVLVPEGARADHHGHLAAFERSGEPLRRMSARAGVRGRRLDGEEFPAEVSICRLEQDGEVLLLAFVRDVSERHDLHRRLDWLELHDPVTGLANRSGIVAALTGRLVAPVGADAPGGGVGMLLGAVLMVDIEGFGFINHAYGTDVGDRVLHAIGERICAVEEFGTPCVARLGDDEFVVHLADVLDDATLERCARHLVELLERALVLDDHVIEIRVAVGARPGSFRPTTAHEVLADAAAALAEGRIRGARHLVTLDEQVRTRSSERVHMLDELWSAIEHDELSLVYQPIVECWSGRPRSAEALLRWTHPTLGEVSPEVFVPLAEQTDLIEELSRWVLHRAARQVAEWVDAPWCDDDFRVAVNISARQLRGPTVVDDLRGALLGASIAPQRLRVEVTETAAMDDLALGQDVLSRIAALGVSLALDDFGTGHSSLARLGRLPIDQIKIDRSFVAEVDRGAAPRAVVDAVLAIAAVFGIGVVAEGVERHAQLDELRALGCPLIQGWYFARAEPAAAFAERAAQLAMGAVRA